MRGMTSSPPPPHVLQAFGLDGDPAPMAGGRGDAWRAGDAVLKPGTDPRYQEWLGAEVAEIEQVGFVLPEVLRAADGRWVVDGWSATRILPGVSSEADGTDWAAVLAAGRAFHRSSRVLPRPAWLADRTDWWARADRAAWDEQPMDVIEPLRPIVAALRPLLAPLGPDQLIHADLTGNMLIAPGRSPGIIDVSPYWRPAAYAEGIVVADAIAWHGADSGLVRDAGVSPVAVARGLLFRVLTTNAMQQEHPDPEGLARDLGHDVRVVDALTS